MNKEKDFCRFCGSTGVSVSNDKYQYQNDYNNILYYIECEDCGAQGPYADSKEEAWKRWKNVVSEPNCPEINKCPKCEYSKPFLINQKLTESNSVTCPHCGLTSSWAKTKFQAISDWNSIKIDKD